MLKPDVPKPPSSEARALRHDLRGRLNALVLCISVLDDETLTQTELLEFIDHIEKTTDKVIELLDQLDLLSD